MTENKRFTSWGNRIKRNGTLLNIEFKTKLDAKLCCKLLNQMDKDQKEYIDKLDEIFKWHKEHYGKSILDERLEFKSDCEKENEQLKEQNKELKQDNDIKFWKLQLMEQWNNTELISHELYLAIENGYEISDKFKKHLDGLKKKHEEHMKKAERLGI